MTFIGTSYSGDDSDADCKASFAQAEVKEKVTLTTTNFKSGASSLPFKKVGMFFNI